MVRPSTTKITNILLHENYPLYGTCKYLIAHLTVQEVEPRFQAMYIVSKHAVSQFMYNMVAEIFQPPKREWSPLPIIVSGKCVVINT